MLNDVSAAGSEFANYVCTTSSELLLDATHIQKGKSLDKCVSKAQISDQTGFQDRSFVGSAVIFWVISQDQKSLQIRRLISMNHYTTFVMVRKKQVVRLFFKVIQGCVC